MKILLTTISTALTLGFSGFTWAGGCVQAKKVCVDGPSTRVISGWPITRDCWKWQQQFQCDDGEVVNDCQPLKDKGCAQTSSTCIAKTADGICSMYEQRYQCMVKPAETTQENCSVNTFCINENGQQRCFDASSSPDPDFGRAVATLESLRQLGTYMNPDNAEIFKGEDNRCSKKLGISNCCKPSNGGSNMTNQIMAMKAGLSVAGNTVDVGSGYVYDAMMNSGQEFMAKGLKSMTNSLGGNFSFTPSVGYMGVSVGIGAPAAGSTALWSTGGEAAVAAVNTANAAAQAAQAAQAAAAAAQAAAAAGTGTAAAAAEAAAAAQAASANAAAAATSAGAATSGQAVIAFNPAAFYVAIAFMVYQELTKCDKDEQTLSLKIGQKLCHPVGSYCSQNSIFGCLVVKETHCCFNSKLARIINEQGREQLGRGWGTPESPQCSGMTMSDFQKIDFSKINLDEFIQDITPKTIDVNSATSKANESIKKISEKYKPTSGTNNYYAQ